MLDSNKGKLLQASISWEHHSGVGTIGVCSNALRTVDSESLYSDQYTRPRCGREKKWTADHRDDRSVGAVRQLVFLRLVAVLLGSGSTTQITPVRPHALTDSAELDGPCMPTLAIIRCRASFYVIFELLPTVWDPSDTTRRRRLRRRRRDEETRRCRSAGKSSSCLVTDRFLPALVTAS